MSQPVTKFPSGATYVEALQNTALCFRDTKLVNARLRLDNLGRPKAISGNFASVFSATTPTGHQYAVKCFTREVADQEIRYRAISDHLSSLTYDWKVDFEYASQGILVEGKRYPILTMEWVDAQNLTRWIDSHLHDRFALAGLANRFAALVGELAAAGIGHGDLQHGNLLVTPNGSIRLVDYDGMYVPALAGLPAAENGHRNYQPPNRSTQDFGPDVDRFSEWVVYLSLFALGVDPSLWQTLRKNGAEQLLLADEDFRDPSSSFRLSMLLGHGEPAVRDLALRFRRLLSQPLSTIPVVTPVTVPSGLATAAVGPGARSLPSWITDHITPAAPAEPPSTFTRRSTALRFSGFITLAMVVAGVILVAFAAAGAAILALAILSAATWFSCAMASYRRQPESRHAAAARTRNSEVTKRMTAVGKTVSVLDQKSRKIDQADSARRAEQTKRQQQLLQQHERDKIAAQQGVQHQLANVDAELQTKSAEHDRKKQSELGLIQSQYVYSQLLSHRIASADINGISTALTAKLRESGIVTAADFVRVSHWQGKVVFQLANHRQVHVPGIGETKAGRLIAWRNDLETRARISQPTSLPNSTWQRIENQYNASVAGLRAEKRRLNESLVQSQAQLAAKLNLDRTDLIDQFRRDNIAAARLRADHDEQLSRARQTFEVVSQEKRTTTSELSAYRRISYRSYLCLTLFGSSTNRGFDG